MPRYSWLIIGLTALLAAPAPIEAQQAAAATAPETIKRIPLQRFEVPGTAYETIIGIAEIVPDVNVGRHTHPGPESGYAIEGGFELLVEGLPPRQIRAGESYMIPANVPHDARTGAEGAKVIATYLIPDGQPIAAPAN